MLFVSFIFVICFITHPEQLFFSSANFQLLRRTLVDSSRDGSMSQKPKRRPGASEGDIISVAGGRQIPRQPEAGPW